MDSGSIQIRSKENTNQTALQMGNYFRDGRTKIGIDFYMLPALAYCSALELKSSVL